MSGTCQQTWYIRYMYTNVISMDYMQLIIIELPSSLLTAGMTMVDCAPAGIATDCRRACAQHTPMSQQPLSACTQTHACTHTHAHTHIPQQSIARSLRIAIHHIHANNEGRGRSCTHPHARAFRGSQLICKYTLNPDIRSCHAHISKNENTITYRIVLGWETPLFVS